MIVKFKIFETWNDNTIDSSIFISGKAKHNPKVVNNTIEYETDDGKYTALIKQIGRSRFICKIYKIDNEGGKIRIKKRIKKSLKTAHNFVREILNDKTDKKKREKEEISKEPEMEFQPEPEPEFSFEPSQDQFYQKPKRKTIIRRFA